MQCIPPKFTRQKFLLSFLKTAGGNLSKLDFQKLLFLCHKKYDLSFFDFIPYLYGCYSFQANADIEVLQAQGWLKVDENSITLAHEPPDFADGYDQFGSFFTNYRNLSGNELIQAVYRIHPYYAINSRIAQNLLTTAEMEKVYTIRKQFKKTSPVLFTIGYEGISFEEYVNTLVRNDVRVLCDVRNNPLSRKFGFSKSMLSAVLPKIGIQYVHIPELGIISAKRQHLATETDYAALFSEYGQALPAKQQFVEKIRALLHDNCRVALTCFEKDPLCCHRHILSTYLQNTYTIDVTDL